MLGVSCRRRLVIFRAGREAEPSALLKETRKYAETMRMRQGQLFPKDLYCLER